MAEKYIPISEFSDEELIDDRVEHGQKRKSLIILG